MKFSREISKNKVYACPYCEFEASKGSQLGAHIFWNHSSPEQKSERSRKLSLRFKRRIIPAKTREAIRRYQLANPKPRDNKGRFVRR